MEIPPTSKSPAHSSLPASEPDYCKYLLNMKVIGWQALECHSASEVIVNANKTMYFSKNPKSCFQYIHSLIHRVLMFEEVGWYISEEWLSLGHDYPASKNCLLCVWACDVTFPHVTVTFFLSECYVFPNWAPVHLDQNSFWPNIFPFPCLLLWNSVLSKETVWLHNRSSDTLVLRRIPSGRRLWLICIIEKNGS